MIKISFAAFAALLLAGGFSTAVYAQAPPPGQPYIQVPIPGMPGFGQQPPEQRGLLDARGRCRSRARPRSRVGQVRTRLSAAGGSHERTRLWNQGFRASFWHFIPAR